jgi:hypothetical protein
VIGESDALTGKLRQAYMGGLLDGWTMSGLFRRLQISGAPKQFIDTRSVEEYIGNNDFPDDMDHALL